MVVVCDGLALELGLGLGSGLQVCPMGGRVEVVDVEQIMPQGLPLCMDLGVGVSRGLGFDSG